VWFWIREIPSPPLCIHQLCFQPFFYLIKFLVDGLAERPHDKFIEREERALYLQGSSIFHAAGTRARPKLGPNIRPCIISHEAHVVVDSISLTVNTPALCQSFTSRTLGYTYFRDISSLLCRRAIVHPFTTRILLSYEQFSSPDQDTVAL
jgi:hypothetical protein